MSTFFDLSRYIVVPIITEWITLQDFLNLEVSLSPTLKSLLLTLIQSYPKKFCTLLAYLKCPNPISFSFYVWLYQRNLPVKQFVRSITVSNSMLLCTAADDYEEIMSDEESDLFRNLTKSIKQLSMDYCLEYNIPLLSSMISHCRKLKKITFSIPHNIESVVWSISQSCPLLESFKVTKCKGITQTTLITLCRNCKQLSELIIITDFHYNNLFVYLVVHGRRLKTLNISIPFHWDVIPKTRSIQMLMMHHACTIKSFNCTTGQIPLHSSNLSASLSSLFLRSIYWYGTSLQHFEINSDICDEPILERLSYVLPNLTSLDLQILNKVLSDSVVYQMARLKQLTSISWFGYNNLFISEFRVIESLPLLDKLVITRCKGIPLLAVYSIVLNVPSLTSITLKEMNVGFVECILFAKLPNLKYLDVGYSKCSLSFVPLKACDSSKIKELSLSYWEKLTCNNLIIIAQHCPMLIVLDLSNCIKIQNNGLLEVIRICPKITDLNVRACKHLTNDVLDALKVYLPRLVVLNIAHCTGITSSAIQKLIYSMSKLRKLTTSIANEIDCDDFVNLELKHV